MCHNCNKDFKQRTRTQIGLSNNHNHVKGKHILTRVKELPYIS